MLVKSVHVFRRVAIALVFILIMLSVIAYARGYRFEFGQPQVVSSRGIIAISASPKASKVYIDGQLKGVTDLNLTLPPGKYTVEVKKDGYSSWKRQVTLKGELVLTLDVLLYPLNPSLTPLTSIGVMKAVPVDRTGKIVLFSQSGDQEKDGIYLFEQGGPLSLLPPLKPIVLKKLLNAEVDFSYTDVVFSPDYKQAVFTFKTKTGSIINSYLLSLDQENTQFFDVTNSKDVLLQAWNEEKAKNMVRLYEAFPKDLRNIATSSVQVVSFSPDETKILYQALKKTEFPQVIAPPLISTNQTPEDRNLTPSNLYVYDIKEDRNYLVQSNSEWLAHFKQEYLELAPISITPSFLPTATPTPLPTISVTEEKPSYIYWHQDSKHLIMNEGEKIVAIGYDGADKQTLYSGPFDQSFFSVTSDNGIVIMTNFNPQNNPFEDLYVVGTK